MPPAHKPSLAPSPPMPGQLAPRLLALPPGSWPQTLPAVPTSLRPGVICTYLQARSGSCGLLPPGVSQHQEAFPEFGSTRTGEIRFDTWLLALPSAGNPGVEASDSPACRHPGNHGSTCAARAPRGPRGSWLPRTPPIKTVKILCYNY